MGVISVLHCLSYQNQNTRDLIEGKVTRQGDVWKRGDGQYSEKSLDHNVRFVRNKKLYVVFSSGSFSPLYSFILTLVFHSSLLPNIFLVPKQQYGGKRICEECLRLCVRPGVLVLTSEPLRSVSLFVESSDRIDWEKDRRSRQFGLTFKVFSSSVVFERL